MSESPLLESSGGDASSTQPLTIEPDPCLLRVGNGRRYIQYEKVDADAFHAWWDTTW